LQAGQTDWLLNKKGQLRPKIRQCTVGCCLLNFRCCCSILFIKISFFSFLRQVPRIKHIFFSISYNTSNQHLNSRPRHLISGSSMLHNGTDGCCCCFFFQFLILLLLFRSGRLNMFLFDITFTLDFLFIFFKFLIKFVSCFSFFSHSFCSSQKTPNIKKFCSVFFISFRCCSRGFRLSRQKKCLTRI